MAQKVVANAPDLRQFASSLERVASQLQDAERQLQSALGRVSATWKDPQRDKCEQEIQQLRAGLRRFQQAAQEQRAYCARLAAHIESTPG